jgi:Ca2+:H+ antiporter
MAKLTWELLIHMFVRPESIRFCSAPKVKVASVEAGEDNETVDGDNFIAHEPMTTGTDVRASAAHSQLYSATPTTPAERYTMKRAKLRAGQLAPSGNPDSTVLLCIYRAVGARYYKYTVGGVNILFVNLIPIVFFVIFDGIVLLPLVEKMHHHGEEVPVFLGFIAGQATIFLLCLASVIPLSYFIGMAVASISAQSSIGMGAVINATFGSIIEIILYGIALTQGKGRLVEGSIVGSILAGVLLMPGMSMCSSALRRKEQVFNAKSASVTSTMLIMAIFGTLTPTLFYQTYGNVSKRPSTLSELR